MLETRPAIESVRDHGHRLTPQRRLVLEILTDSQDHLDAESIYLKAKQRDEHISLATVYRNLRLFKEQDLISERHLGEAHCYYEMKCLGEHQHLVCEACGRVIEFESPLIRKLVAEVQQKNRFYVTKVELYLEGYCPKCKKEGK